MPTLNVTVLNKIATGDRQIVVCDNTDYIVHFDLDAEWGDYDAKTMRILYTDNTYDDILFTGTDCALPRIYNAQSIRIGIYAGDLHATAAAVFECKKSVLSDEGQHVEPTEDVYNQIMDAINSGMLKGDTGNGIASITKTATSGNVDTYTILFTDGTETTYDVTNGSVTSVDGLTGDVVLDYKANIDGYYDGLTAGTADQLLSNKTITDNAPYVNRQSGGGNHVGDRKEIKEIVGSSVIWQQLCENGNFADSTQWTANTGTTLSVTNNVATFTATATNGRIQHSNIAYKAGHIYLTEASVKISSGQAQMAASDVAGSNAFTQTTGTFERLSVIHTFSEDTTTTFPRFYDKRESGWDGVQVKDVVVYDLTPTSSAIANRAYTMEQSTAGSGVAWLKSYGFFTKPYYAYTASPSIQSVKVSAHETVGRNLFDSDTIMAAKGFVQQSDGSWYSSNGRNNTGSVWANDVGYKGQINLVMTVKGGSTSQRGAMFQYDYTDGTSSKAYYTMSTSYANNSFLSTSGKVVKSISITYGTQNIETWFKDICINLHGDRDGEYEAYHKNTYAFDSTKTLNGIWKLDENYNIYAYGDRYRNDRTIDRVFGVVDMGTLTWSMSTITDHNRFQATNLHALVKFATDNIICTKYPLLATHTSNFVSDKVVATSGSTQDNGRLWVWDDSYTDAETFKSAMSGVYLLYELAEPTTETADAYQQVMAEDPDGTERWIDAEYVAGNRDFEMPVGHSTEYHVDLKAKLEDLPDSPNSDGDYLLRRRNGVNSYVRFVSELPAEPTEDGVYTLTATVSDGVATYSWEA